MANPNKDNLNNLKKLGEKLKVLAQLEAEQNPFKGNPTIAQMLKEGNAILVDEAKKSAVEEKKSVLTSPYAEARRLALKSMPGWKRNELLAMESKHDLENRLYNDFIKDVAKKGDELSG